MSEPSGVGYGGDRPGIWVEPKRDEAVSLEACNIKACDKDWVVTPTKKDNKILYTISTPTNQKICSIIVDSILTPQQLESILTKELGKAMTTPKKEAATTTIETPTAPPPQVKPEPTPQKNYYTAFACGNQGDTWTPLMFVICMGKNLSEAAQNVLYAREGNIPSSIVSKMLDLWYDALPKADKMNPPNNPQQLPKDLGDQLVNFGPPGAGKQISDARAMEIVDRLSANKLDYMVLLPKENPRIGEALYRIPAAEISNKSFLDLKAYQRLPHDDHADEVVAVNESNEEALLFCPISGEMRWTPYIPEHRQHQPLATPEAYPVEGSNKKEVLYSALQKTTSLNKKAGTWELPDSPKRARRLVTLLAQAAQGQIASVELLMHDLYSVFGDDALFDELDMIKTASAWEAVPIIKFHLDRMLQLYIKNPDNFSEDWDPTAWAILQPLLSRPLKLPVRQIPDDLSDLASKKTTLNKKAELIREIHKATDQYNYNGTEYNLSNGTLKKDQVIPLSKTHVRLTDPTKSRYERYAGNGEWQLISDVDFAKYKAEWDEINKKNYGVKASLNVEKVTVRQALLEDLKKNCPDCYAKFKKFAKEKGVRITIDREANHNIKPGDTVTLKKNWMSLLQEQFGQGASYWEDEVSKLILNQPGAEDDPEYSVVPLKVERVGDIAVDSDNTFPIYVDIVVVDSVEIPVDIVEKRVTKQADLDQLLKQVETIRTRINTVKERIKASGSKKKADNFPGGLADKKKPEDFDQTQLEKGVKVEMEHTDDPEKAKEIAMDHLVEDAVYYDKLQQMENKDTHPIEENAVVELVKWIELDLDMIENAYRDRPEVIKHIENIENQITELEQKLGLEHTKPIHEMEEKEHRVSFLKTQLQKKFAAHIQRGDAYVLRLLENFDYEYEKDIQAILSNGASIDERFAAIKTLIPELFNRLIDDKQIDVKQIEWSPVEIDDQDIMKIIEDYDDSKVADVEKEGAAYKTPKPTTPPPQGFQWAYDPKLASWNLVATE